MVGRKRLDGRVVHITGGGRRIGRAIVFAYAAEGARLALSARTAAELEETAQLVSGQYGTDVITITANVSEFGQVENAVRMTLEHFGAIDIMVNNARNIGPVGWVWDNATADWARTIAVHLREYSTAATPLSRRCWSGAAAVSSTCRWESADRMPRLTTRPK